MKNIVSVIIPIYNSKKYLSECIDSVLSQSYKKIEIVLVDNGSSDGSIEVCNEYAKTAKNIKFYQEKKNGAGAARALGVEKSTGDYIIFLDSDDCISKTAIGTIVDTFSKSKADIVRFHGCYYPGGRILESIDTDGKKYTRLSHYETINMLALTDKLSSMCFQAYRKECFKDVKFAEGISYCEDYLTNQEIHKQNWKVVVTGNVLYHYRVNMDSTTKTASRKRLRKNIDERIYACSKTLKFVEENVSDDRIKSLAAGYQIDRVRSDMLKLFSKYSRKNELTHIIDEVFSLAAFDDLVNQVSRKSVDLYLSGLGTAERLKKGNLIKAIYDRNVNKAMRATMLYRVFLKFRNMKTRGQKWA